MVGHCLHYYAICLTSSSKVIKVRFSISELIVIMSFSSSRTVLIALKICLFLLSNRKERNVRKSYGYKFSIHLWELQHKLITKWQMRRVGWWKKCILFCKIKLSCSGTQVPYIHLLKCNTQSAKTCTIL